MFWLASLAFNHHTDIVVEGYHIEIAASRHLLEGDAMARGLAQFTAKPLGDVPLDGMASIVNVVALGAFSPAVLALIGNPSRLQISEEGAQLVFIATDRRQLVPDRKSTRLNSSHPINSY